MKKRSFLLPIATSIAALIVAGGTASAAPVAPTIAAPTVEASATPAVTPKPLVIQRARGARMAQHVSHASHASHASHVSSR